ncbi:MAG: hydantoinase/oxoprolinase family protein [Betaproteobacteria bacterium]|nr:hydantoinase/oxoprolinase family protein [Betaproteobacteria bacterium]
MSRFWIGIDTGGTFTDIVLVDIGRGDYRYYKLPTTTEDPSLGILQGIQEIVEQAGGSCAEIAFLVLGTTLATNAVLEGKTARTGMVTTAGFRDVLELARQRRPHYFNLDVPKPLPPATRDCRIEIDERVDHSGRVLAPVDQDQVCRAAALLRSKGMEAVAVCFLHSYANATHERIAREALREVWPDAYVCASHEVLAEFREFERFATTAVNASLMPIMDRYMERFEQGVRALGVTAAPRVMQSNGGAVSPAAVRRMPVNTFFSGPAGGVVGTRGLGKQLGVEDLIAFDMGGTSTDVCLIRALTPAQKSQRDMGGFPVRTRTIDIHTIGAGGGSIAWVDPGGLLKVGPMSAGAVPGPAAYGRGGTRPTVTDANVVLGRLNPKTLLGGRMVVYPTRARAAIEKELCASLGVDLFAAAAGILDIVNANMMGAVRVISVEQGEDPREFALVAFGGAGPLHAADIARSMGIGRVIVPPRPGLLSAIGLLHADIRGDFSLTRFMRAEAANLGAINAGFAQLRAQAETWLAGEAGENAPAQYEWSLDLRYVGQNFELIQPCPSANVFPLTLEEVIEAFHRRHREFYGYDMAGQPVEIVNLRVVVTVARPQPPLERPASGGNVLRALIETRSVWFPEAGFANTPVYKRDLLPAGTEFDGPLIIEQMDTTTVVPPRAAFRVDASGAMHLKLASSAQPQDAQ